VRRRDYPRDYPPVTLAFEKLARLALVLAALPCLEV